MVQPSERISGRRLRPLVMGVCSLGLMHYTGCAFPHGSTGGDPLLGNWNRPISPTPMPYAGGSGSGSPAYDGGARLGMPSPDVVGGAAYNAYESNPAAKTSWNMPGLAPTTTELAGGKKPRTSQFGPTFVRTGPGDGAKIQTDESPTPLIPYRPVPEGIPSTSQVLPRNEAIGSVLLRSTAIAPSPSWNPSTVVDAPIQSLDEGKLILASYGASMQSMTQTDTGEWHCVCVAPLDAQGATLKRIDAKHKDPIEAVRAAVAEVKKR